MVRRQVCSQRLRNGGLGIPDQENHWFTERLAYSARSLSTDVVWRQKASDSFLRFKSDPKVEGRLKLRGEALFVRECRKALRNLFGSNDLSQSRNELYQEVVVGFASDPLVDQLGSSMEEVRSH